MSELETELNISSMKVADLKRELKSRGLSVTGNKNELIERLQLAVMGTDNDILGEEEADSLLKEEEEEEEVEEEEEEEGGKAAVPAEVPKKKVAIKRDVAIPTSIMAEETKENTKDENKAETKSEESETKQTSPPLSVEEQKAARAARFGMTNDSAVLEKLRQRGERFGQSTSSSLKKLEDDERMRKRKERFGIVSANEPTPKRASIIDPAMDEKLKKRAERFGVVSNDEKKKLRAQRFGIAT